MSHLPILILLLCHNVLSIGNLREGCESETCVVPSKKPSRSDNNPIAVLKDIIAESIKLDEEDRKKNVKIIEEV